MSDVDFIIVLIIVSGYVGLLFGVAYAGYIEAGKQEKEKP